MGWCAGASSNPRETLGPTRAASSAPRERSEAHDTKPKPERKIVDAGRRTRMGCRTHVLPPFAGGALRREIREHTPCAARSASTGSASFKCVASPPTPDSTPQRVAAIREQLSDLHDFLDPEGLARRVAELEGEMGALGFWDDQEAATKVSAEHSRTSRRLDTWQALERDVDDLGALIELADEDDSLVGEVDEQLVAIEGRLGALEEARLFSGRYDGGDALVTVNAGAGGTDAQDWAEMVLRMMMR